MRRRKEIGGNVWKRTSLGSLGGFLVIGYDLRNLHGHILKLVADLLRRRRRQAAAGNALGGVFRLSAGVNQKGSHQNLKDKVA